jgi:predicted membrane protein
MFRLATVTMSSPTHWRIALKLLALWLLAKAIIWAYEFPLSVGVWNGVIKVVMIWILCSLVIFTVVFRWRKLG